jgi:hypothetical protein
MEVIKLKRNDNNFKNEIFNKSPIGILYLKVKRNTGSGLRMI